MSKINRTDTRLSLASDSTNIALGIANENDSQIAVFIKHIEKYALEDSPANTRILELISNLEAADTDERAKIADALYTWSIVLESQYIYNAIH